MDALSDDELDAMIEDGIERLEGYSKGGENSVKVLECPECGRSDMDYVAGMETGKKYLCKHCGYEGAFVVERMKTPDELRAEEGLQ